MWAFNSFLAQEMLILLGPLASLHSIQSIAIRSVERDYKRAELTRDEFVTEVDDLMREARENHNCARLVVALGNTSPQGLFY